MDKTMWAVQVNEFPDSVKLEDSQVLEMIMSAVPDWLRDMTVEQWREELIGGYDNASDELLAFRAWCDKETMRARFMWSISAFGNKTTVGTSTSGSVWDLIRPTTHQGTWG
jgi:hypothetical protein